MSNTVMEEIVALLEREIPTDKHLRLVFWQDTANVFKQIKALEMELRKEAVENFFVIKDCKEGTNTVDLGNEWKLKFKHGVNRKVDQQAVAAVFEHEDLKDVEIDELIKQVPELIKKRYNGLSAKQRLAFDECLIIKHSTPALELVPPKEKKE